MKKIRILLADDHALMRAGIRALLEKQDDMEVIGEAADGREALQNVAALWFFTSDLVFVLLFPQLVMALFDRRANLVGSIAAFSVSLVIRLGAGEPLFGWAPWIPYPELFATVLPGETADWYDAQSGAIMFPFKTLAALAGLVVLPVVSRLSSRVCPPQALVPESNEEAMA